VSGDIDAQAVTGSAGTWLLLVNKRNRPISVTLPTDFTAVHVRMVAAGVSLATTEWNGRNLTLPLFAVVSVLSK
jgi:hypothetical protein